MAGHFVEFEPCVTNIYRCEAGGWKIVHHHTDISPAMLEVPAGVKSGFYRPNQYVALI
jgi:hypothetical protein